MHARHVSWECTSGVEMRVFVRMAEEVWSRNGSETVMVVQPPVTFQCVRLQPLVDVVIVP